MTHSPTSKLIAETITLVEKAVPGPWKMSQIDLPFQKHSETSLDAAISMQENAKTLRAKVFLFIKEHGPCSDEKIQIGLKMNPSTQRPRRIELLRAGMIQEHGKTKTKSGRSAVTWEAVKK